MVLSFDLHRYVTFEPTGPIRVAISVSNRGNPLDVIVEIFGEETA